MREHKRDGRFPRAVWVAYKGVRWKESDITVWIETRPAAAE